MIHYSYTDVESMKKLLLLGCCFTLNTFATIQPYFTYSTGLAVDVLSQPYTNVTFTGSNNSYALTRSADANWLNAVAVGIQIPMSARFDLQEAIALYLNNMTVHGDVLQFGDPSMNNVMYHYTIASKAVVLESKFRFHSANTWRPYVLVDVGASFNRARDYNEYPYDTNGGAVDPMSVPFANRSTTQWTYAIGIGMDKFINPHCTLGFGYRFADLGNAGLGPTSLQTNTATLSIKPIYANELLIQLTII
jgi:opacity protein-like surface antigen